MRLIITLAILSLLIVGCSTPYSSNPYSQFYYDLTGVKDIITIPTIVITKDKPKIFRGNNQEEETLQMLEDGYGLIGYSAFNTKKVKEKIAIDQANKIHASVVIIYSKYNGTVSGIMPLTLSTSQISDITLSSNADSSGMTYVPYDINRSDYFATYWIKKKTPIFGVIPQELPANMRLEVQGNKGVSVFAVIKGSPAFQADILRGDVITEIGNIKINDNETYSKTLGEYIGQKVNIVIIRDGKEIEKEIQLNKRSE